MHIFRFDVWESTREFWRLFSFEKISQFYCRLVIPDKIKMLAAQNVLHKFNPLACSIYESIRRMRHHPAYPSRLRRFRHPIQSDIICVFILLSVHVCCVSALVVSSVVILLNSHLQTFSVGMSSFWYRKWQPHQGYLGWQRRKQTEVTEG